MLNRRILRIKAFKLIYAYAINDKITLDEALADLDNSCEATRDLYLFMLGIIPQLTGESARRIASGKAKFNPTEEELHPNEKFAGCALSKLIASDPDFKKISDKRKLSWQPYDLVVRKILDSIVTKDYYTRYMESEGSSLSEDCRLFTKIYEHEFTESPEIEAILEDLNLYWTDDLAYSLTYCCRTLEELAKGKSWRLPDLYQSDLIRKKDPEAKVDSDRDFVRKLLRCAYSSYGRYVDSIVSSVTDWDKDRLFSTDIALIVMGLAEAENFPEIPVRVTLNEYVEISKYYASPKSRSFVNGLLDKLIKSNDNLNKQI